MPEPLHPAIVHFPIVLILVGAVMAVGAAFWRKHQLPLFTAVFLSLGTLGCWLAMESGESDGETIEQVAPQIESLLEEHEDWAERTFGIATAASVIAIASVALIRFPRMSRAIAMMAAFAGLAAGYAVYQTGHHGGALVYRDGSATSLVENVRSTEAHKFTVDPD